MGMKPIHCCHKRTCRQAEGAQPHSACCTAPYNVGGRPQAQCFQHHRLQIGSMTYIRRAFSTFFDHLCIWYDYPQIMLCTSLGLLHTVLIKPRHVDRACLRGAQHSTVCDMASHRAHRAALTGIFRTRPAKRQRMREAHLVCFRGGSLLFLGVVRQEGAGPCQQDGGRLLAGHQ